MAITSCYCRHQFCLCDNNLLFSRSYRGFLCVFMTDQSRFTDSGWSCSSGAGIDGSDYLHVQHRQHRPAQVITPHLSSPANCTNTGQYIDVSRWLVSYCTQQARPELQHGGPAGRGGGAPGRARPPPPQPSSPRGGGLGL